MSVGVETSRRRDVLRTGRWTDDAACLGIDVDTFYPPMGASYGPARRLCGTCPVAADCRRMADRAERGLPIGHLFGMFAGETPAERARRRGEAPLFGAMWVEWGTSRAGVRALVGGNI